MLTPERAAELKAEADADLTVIEAEYERLRTQREALRQLSALYKQIIAAALPPGLPASIVIVSPSREVAAVSVASRSTDNFTTRVTRVLQSSAPRKLTARQILVALQAEGWTTKSQTPMTIVRNTMADLCRRVPQMFFVKNPIDGTVEYGWRVAEPHEEGSS